MGNFRTDDDYTPMDVSNYPTDPGPTYGGYDNPEMGNYPGGYGNIKKPNIFSRIWSALGSAGAGAGSAVSKGITLEKVLLGLYLIAMVVIVINISTVLDFLFYATVSILQYVIVVLVVILLGYVFCRYVLKIR